MKLIKTVLVLVSIVFVLSALNTISSSASPYEIEVEQSSSGSTSNYYLLFSFDQFIATSTTVIVNLPIVEQNVSMETPSPDSIEPDSNIIVALETLTPTPTSIPQQTGSTNLPIVVGAAAIIVVVVLAWLFVSYLPNKNKE